MPGFVPCFGEECHDTRQALCEAFQVHLLSKCPIVDEIGKVPEQDRCSKVCHLSVERTHFQNYKRLKISSRGRNRAASQMERLAYGRNHVKSALLSILRQGLPTNSQAPGIGSCSLLREYPCSCPENPSIARIPVERIAASDRLGQRKESRCLRLHCHSTSFHRPNRGNRNIPGTPRICVQPSQIEEATPIGEFFEKKVCQTEHFRAGSLFHRPEDKVFGRIHNVNKSQCQIASGISQSFFLSGK